MLISESELNSFLAANSTIVAFLLLSRPSSTADAQDPSLVDQVDGEDAPFNICDVYLFIDQGGSLQVRLHTDQLSLPVGAIDGGARLTVKAVPSTLRSNVLNIVGGG